jgi:hypothetical protein
MHTSTNPSVGCSTAAFRAITVVADVAALKLSEELGAFGDVHVFLFPQR